MPLRDLKKTKCVNLRKLSMAFKKHERPYGKINIFLTQHGVKKSIVISNMYYLILDSKYTIVLLYVDDLLLVGDNHDELNRIKSILIRKFDMTILGDAKLYLGAELERAERLKSTCTNKVFNKNFYQNLI